MKKAFIIIAAISLMLCFCVSVSAAETTYRIEEGKMSLQLPDSWVVYTRDMPKEDANIAAYYTNHTEMIAYMEKYKVYMEALPNEKMMIGIKIWPAEELSNQFRELLGTEDKIEREKKLTDMMDNAPAGDVQLVGLYESNPGGSSNWLYLENTIATEHYVVDQYIAVVGDKAVFVYGVPTEDYMLSADNKAILEQVLGKIVYDKSVMTSSSPAPKQETTPQSPSQQDSFANQNNQTTARTGLDMRTILLIGLAVVVVSVVAIVGMKLLRKKKSL